jgi:glycosyltransferase involved in cell wall biosynthesis
VPVRHFPWALASEVAALETFDVGLMPLTDDPWARGKGGYKILQYMAVGIPTVASPVGINAEMVRPGVTGFLAGDQETWVTALEALVLAAELRARLGAQARECAVERYSLAHAAPILLDALFPGRPAAAMAVPRIAS